MADGTADRALMERRENLGLGLERRAACSPEREALVDVATDTRLSWRELDARVNQLAQALLARGIRSGDRVALLLPNGLEIFESLLAVAKLGGVVVPINWRLVAKEIAFLLADSGARCLIYGDQFEDAVRQLQRGEGDEELQVEHWLRCGAGAPPDFAVDYAELRDAAPATPPETTTWGDDPVLILYTSGTTGRPKGAVHSHRTAMAGAVSFGREFEIRRGDRYLLFMPAFHVGALLPALVCIQNGATCVVMAAFDAELSWQVVKRERITNSLAVPTMLQDLLPALERGEADASSVRWFMTGAAPIPPSLLEAYMKHGVEIIAAYGLTEAFGGGCVLTPEDAPERIGSVGKPWFYLEGRVVDDKGADCPPREPGEILLRGPSVMRGYWNRPDASAETLAGGWLHTGDIAVRDEEGFYTIKDRSKDMIISGGENIYPAEIENVLHGHPGIADVAVIGQPSERWGESPFAVVVRTEPSLRAEDVLEFCDGRMARFKRPKGVAFVDELPRNPSGKLLKFELRRRYPGPGPGVDGTRGQMVARIPPLLALLWLAGSAAAQPVALESVAEIPSPIYATHAGDERLFVAGRDGRIWIWTAADGVEPDPFLDLSSLVDTTQGGRPAVHRLPPGLRQQRLLLRPLHRRGSLPLGARPLPGLRGPDARRAEQRGDPAGAGPARHQPQRRAAPVRPGRLPLRRLRGRRRRRRPRVPRPAGRQLLRHAAAPGRGPERLDDTLLRDSRRQPLRRGRRRHPGRDLGHRPAQPLALLLRPRNR